MPTIPLRRSGRRRPRNHWPSCSCPPCGRSSLGSPPRAARAPASDGDGIALEDLDCLGHRRLVAASRRPALDGKVASARSFIATASVAVAVTLRARRSTPRACTEDHAGSDQGPLVEAQVSPSGRRCRRRCRRPIPHGAKPPRRQFRLRLVEARLGHFIGNEARALF